MFASELVEMVTELIVKFGDREIIDGNTITSHDTGERVRLRDAVDEVTFDVTEGIYFIEYL